MVRRAWLMAVVGTFVIWFAVFIVAGCSGTRSKVETSLPHNGKIAFAVGGAVYTIEPDGSNLRPALNENAQGTLALKASWSPDGTKIAFTREIPEGHYRFSVVEPDGSNLRDLLLTELPMGSYPVSGPTWSPDGEKLAFSSVAGPNHYRDIYRIDSDGSNLINLTNTPGLDDLNPAFSPDGSQMCLYHASGRATPAAGIYVMEADGSDPNLLVDDADADQCDWSPDGRKIAYASLKDGDWDIYTMDADGSGLTKLTSNSIWDQYPDWSPDGRKIAYASGRPNGLDIHTMDADGSDFAQVTNGGAAAQYPDWQPLPRPTEAKPEKQQEESQEKQQRRSKQDSKSRNVTVHPPDTGGPSLLLAASAPLFSGGVMFYAGLKRRV